MEAASISPDTTTENQAVQNEPDASGHESWIKKWGSLVVLSLALAIIIIDTTLLNVSIGNIIHDLNTDIQSIQWVITAYALMLAAFTITGGRLGDLFGRKRMFVLGAIIFAIGSYIASISQSVGPLIWGEAIIEGIGAALMMPATSSLLVSNFRGRDRAIAFGIWGGIAAASSAVGPILGGFLTTHYSWRWGFRINIAVAVLVLLGAVLIKEARGTNKKTGLDFIGVILSSLGLLSLVFAFIKAADYGWLKAKEQLVLWGHTLDLGSLSVVPVFVVLGVVILALFMLWERHIERKGRVPLVSLGLFKNRQFISGATTMAIQSLGLSGMIFAIPVFLQAVRGLDAFHTGLAMLPLSVTLLIVSPLSVLFSKRISPTRLIQAGLFINTIGFVLLQYSLTVDATANDLIAGFAVFGVGMGLVMAQVSNLTLSAVPVDQAGEASGVNNTLRQVGATLGSAIIGAILISTLTTNLVKGIDTSSQIPQNIKPVITEAVSKQTSSVEFGGGLQIGRSIPQVIKDEIVTISHKATTDANRTALAYGALFAFLGFLTSLFIPKVATIQAKYTPPASQSANSSEATPIAAIINANLESKPVVKSSKGMFAAVVGLVVVFGSLGALAYIVGRDHKDEPLPPAPVVAIDPQPGVAVVPPPPAVVSQTPPPAPASLPSVTPPVVVAPTPAPATPASPSPAPRPVSNPTIFTNVRFGLTFTIPGSWKNVSASEAGDSLVVYNGQTGEQYGTVTRYAHTADTLDTVLAQLSSSPNITNIQSTSVKGLGALRFWSTTGQGIVFIKDDILFYMTDRLSLDPVITSLQLS